MAGADGRTVRFADGSSLDVGIVIWTTGYRPDYSWIHIPGIVGDEHVIHRCGVTDVPGLYFLALPWQHRRGSALLGFIREDAAHLTDRITSRAPGQAARPPGRFSAAWVTALAEPAEPVAQRLRQVRGHRRIASVCAWPAPGRATSPVRH